jgi:hypothetical protein
MELPDDDVEMSKHVAVWIMYRDTLVIIIVHLLVIIQIKSNNINNITY